MSLVEKNKPKNCCNVGSYECAIPMLISGRRRDVDLCIADIITALNAANIKTTASCCGHKQSPGNILLEDNRVLIIIEEKHLGTALKLLQDQKIY